MGDWEDEHSDKVITESIAPALKNYAILFSDDKFKIKAKGFVGTRATSKILNFKTLVDMVLKKKSIKIPQFTMDYELGKGTTSRRFLKEIKFNPKTLKGVYDENTHMVAPFGYRGE